MKKLLNYLVLKRKKLKKNLLPLHEPNLTKIDEREVIKGMRTGFVSTAGKEIFEFECKIKKITKSKYVVSTINGTSAIHTGLKALGVQSNDEVLLPTISFIAVSYTHLTLPTICSV